LKFPEHPAPGQGLCVVHGSGTDTASVQQSKCSADWENSRVERAWSSSMRTLGSFLVKKSESQRSDGLEERRGTGAYGEITSNINTKLTIMT